MMMMIMMMMITGSETQLFPRSTVPTKAPSSDLPKRGLDRPAAAGALGLRALAAAG